MFKIPELLVATKGKLLSGDKNINISGISIDSRTIRKGMGFIAIKGNNYDGHDFISEVIKKGASSLIVDRDPGKIKGATVIRVKDTIRALGDIARFHRNRFRIPVITVTGSNGKTTTKDMIAHVLSKEFRVLKNEGTENNHIGLPISLLKLNDSYDAAVFEIGTNHFGEVKYLSEIAGANIGVVTNIGPSHLEHLKDLNGVFREKYDLIKYLRTPAVAILNADDYYLGKKISARGKGNFIIGLGVNRKSDYSATDICEASGKYSFILNGRLRFALNVPGYYNIYNSLAAIALARILGMEYKSIIPALSSFRLPKGRLNLLKIKGVRFIDDTYNSNPLSLSQALEFLNCLKAKGRKISVIGDMLELGSKSRIMHQRAIEDAAKSSDILVVVGKIGRSSLKLIRNSECDIYSCLDSSQAREVLFKQIKTGPGDIVLVKGSRRMKMERVFNY